MARLETPDSPNPATTASAVAGAPSAGSGGSAAEVAYRAALEVIGDVEPVIAEAIRAGRLSFAFLEEMQDQGEVTA